MSSSFRGSTLPQSFRTSAAGSWELDEGSGVGVGGDRGENANACNSLFPSELEVWKILYTRFSLSETERCEHFTAYKKFP